MTDEGQRKTVLIPYGILLLNKMTGRVPKRVSLFGRDHAGGLHEIFKISKLRLQKSFCISGQCVLNFVVQRNQYVYIGQVLVCPLQK